MLEYWAWIGWINMNIVLGWKRAQGEGAGGRGEAKDHYFV